MATWKIMLSLQGLTTVISIIAIAIYMALPEEEEES